MSWMSLRCDQTPDNNVVSIDRRLRLILTAMVLLSSLGFRLSSYFAVRHYIVLTYDGAATSVKLAGSILFNGSNRAVADNLFTRSRTY